MRRLVKRLIITGSLPPLGLGGCNLLASAFAPATAANGQMMGKAADWIGEGKGGSSGGKMDRG